MNHNQHRGVAALKGLRCEWPKCRQEADMKAPDGKWYCDIHNGERVDKLYKEAVGRHKKGTQRR